MNEIVNLLHPLADGTAQSCFFLCLEVCTSFLIMLKLIKLATFLKIESSSQTIFSSANTKSNPAPAISKNHSGAFGSSQSPVPKNPVHAHLCSKVVAYGPVDDVVIVIVRHWVVANFVDYMVIYRQRHRGAATKCAVPPDHLRGEISFSRTCNIPNIGKTQKQGQSISIKCALCSCFKKILYIFY